MSPPSTRRAVVARSVAPAVSKTLRSLTLRLMWTSGCASARAVTVSVTWESSVESARRNLRRAGVLKNRSSTRMVVPSGQPTGVTTGSAPPSRVTRTPESAPRWRVVQVTFEIEAIEGRASPRKPMVVSFHRSSASWILLVAKRSKASTASSGGMPRPSSTMVRERPPSEAITWIRDAPASMAFSTSSLTTELGRSTTSPAAIWLAMWRGRR
ncbi:hypothetical protein D3C87_1479050 [compost metagenome]